MQMDENEYSSDEINKKHRTKKKSRFRKFFVIKSNDTFFLK